MNERIHGGVGQTSGADKPQTGEVQRDTILADVVRRLDIVGERLNRSITRISSFRNRVYPETPCESAQGRESPSDETLSGAISVRLERLHELSDRVEQLAEDCERIG